jgi:hypothetical protein
MEPEEINKVAKSMSRGRRCSVSAECQSGNRPSAVQPTSALGGHDYVTICIYIMIYMYVYVRICARVYLIVCMQTCVNVYSRQNFF